MNRNGSTAIIVLLIVVILIVGIWLYITYKPTITPSSSPISSNNFQSGISPTSTIVWQKYTSAMYRYTIQYPAAWIATSTMGGSGKQFENTSIYSPGDPKSGIGISDVETCSSNQPLLNCAQGYIGIYQNNQAAQWTHTAFATTTVNTYPAVSTNLATILNGQSQGTSRFIFFQKNADLFKITFSLNQSSADIDIVNQMISTFSFN